MSGTYEYIHVGSADMAARLMRVGWELVREYPPVSPVIEGAWWLRRRVEVEDDATA